MLQMVNHLDIAQKSRKNTSGMFVLSFKNGNDDLTKNSINNTCH